MNRVKQPLSSKGIPFTLR